MSDVKEFEVLGRVINIKDAQARNLINAMQKDVSLTELVVLGDSYSQGYLSGGAYAQYPMPVVIANMLHLNLHNFGVNASGFTISGNDFAMQAANAIADTTYDHTKVKYVMVIGGINDYMHSLDVSAVHTAAVSLYSTLSAAFKNAKIVYAPCWTSVSIDTKANKVFLDAGRVPEIADVPIITLYDNLKCLLGYPDLMGADNVHPTETGYYTLASNIVAMLSGGILPRGRDIEVTPTAAWDTSNLLVTRGEDSIHVSGYAKALQIITLSDLQIGTIGAGCAFARSDTDRTYRFLAGVWNNNDNQGKMVKGLITGSFDVPSGYQDGDIYLFHDFGGTINAGDEVWIECDIPLLHY